MAWRPEKLVRCGQIDNTTLGWTVGWLELEGFEERLQLKLTEDEWNEQARQNAEELSHFLMQLGDAIENSPLESD